MLRLLLVLPVIQGLTVIDLPGDWSQILRHKFTPDKPWDPKELSICMRFYPHKAEIEKVEIDNSVKTRVGSLAALRFCLLFFSVILSVFLSFWHPVDILTNFCFDN